MDDRLAVLALSIGEVGARGLLPHVEEQDYADGEALYYDGGPSAHMHLVVKGEVEVRQEYLGSSVTLGVRGPGTWFGEVGFVDAGPATATVVARGPVSTLRVDHTTLIRLSTDHPEVASALLRHVNREMALRIAQSSSGIMEHVGPGRYRLRKPHEVRSWTSRALAWLLGAQERT